jgi:hypothetical protein
VPRSPWRPLTHSGCRRRDPRSAANAFSHGLHPTLPFRFVVANDRFGIRERSVVRPGYKWVPLEVNRVANVRVTIAHLVTISVIRPATLIRQRRIVSNWASRQNDVRGASLRRVRSSQ